MLRLYFNNYINTRKTDYFGIIASGLCLIHCFATPFIFFVKSCSATCCAETPVWWKLIDYIFLFISLITVRHAIKTSISGIVKLGLGISWTLLLLLIVNDSFIIFSINENLLLIPACSLIAFHFYNIKFCECKKGCC
jgi:hypothetical protein